MPEPKTSRDMERLHRRSIWACLLAIWAIPIGGGGTKIVPGGPFFSIGFDILPGLAAMISIGLCFRSLRERPWEGFFASLLPLILSTIAFGNVFVAVYSLWHRQYARGVLIGL